MASANSILPEIHPEFDTVPESKLPFREAAARWLRLHSPYIGPRTQFDRVRCSHKLIEFFADKPLGEITRYDLVAYQTWRKEQAKKNKRSHQTFPGHHRANNEIGVLRLILKWADVWEPLEKHYKPLPTDHVGPGQAITPEELRRLVEIGRSKGEMVCCAQLLNSERQHNRRSGGDSESSTAGYRPEGPQHRRAEGHKERVRRDSLAGA